jgi:SPX domain
MKFSHNLKFNAVPEWRVRYLDYSKLKKLSYAIEKLVRSIKGRLPRRCVAPSPDALAGLAAAQHYTLIVPHSPSPELGGGNLHRCSTFMRSTGGAAAPGDELARQDEPGC